MLGRYVVPRLRTSGHDVLGLSRTGAGQHVRTDYSLASLGHLLQGADAVIDLAATRPLPGREVDATSTIVTGAALVQAAARAGVGVLVQASSVAVYDPAASRPLTEDSPTAPRSAYGLAKFTVECWAQLPEYADVRTVSLRLSHLLGAGDDTGWLVSTYLRLGAQDAELPVHDPLGPARDLLYAGDAARALELALVTDTATGPITIAGPHLFSPAQLAQAVSEEIGGRVVGGDPAWRHTAARPTTEEIDTSLARAVLGFSPAHDVRSALREIRRELTALTLAGDPA